MHKKYSYLFAIVTMTLWGTAFPLSKKIIDGGIHPTVFLALRMGFAFLALFLYILVTGQTRQWFLTLQRHFWELLAMGAFFYAGSYLIQYFGVLYTTAINQTLISNTSTFWVVILNYVFYRHKPSKMFIASMVMGFLGILLIMLQDGLKFTSESLLGDLLTILSFFVWSLYLIGNRAVTADKQEDPLIITTAVLLFVCLTIVPLSFGFGLTTEIPQLTMGDWAIIAYLGIACSGVATLFYTIALSNKDIPSENVVLIGFLLPVVGIITSIFVLGESLTWNIVVGCIIVLISVFLVESKESGPES